MILEGYGGALVAAKRLAGKKHLLVVYQETDRTDGFVVTAYFSKRVGQKKVLWREQT
jgi:hypothetical protein